MQGMKDLLRTTLGKSLDALSPLDRLAAAWPVAAGHGTAERTSVTAIDGTVATITVPDAGWQAQLQSMAPMLAADLARISRVPLTDILFLLPAAPVPLPGGPPTWSRTFTPSAPAAGRGRKNR